MNAHRSTVLDVEGMTCGSCVRHIDAALRDLPGVTSVDVRLREGETLVVHDPDLAPLETLVAALAREGYAATPSS